MFFDFTGIIAQPYGEVWKEQRRFSLMLFRNFGVGKNLMQERILEESAYLIQAFTKNQSKLSWERMGKLKIVILMSLPFPQDTVGLKVYQ